MRPLRLATSLTGIIHAISSPLPGRDIESTHPSSLVARQTGGDILHIIIWTDIPQGGLVVQRADGSQMSYVAVLSETDRTALKIFHPSFPKEWIETHHGPLGRTPVDNVEFDEGTRTIADTIHRQVGNAPTGYHDILRNTALINGLAPTDGCDGKCFFYLKRALKALFPLPPRRGSLSRDEMDSMTRKHEYAKSKYEELVTVLAKDPSKSQACQAWLIS